jgi:hypothetical protein
VADDGARTGLDAALLDAADTLIVIGLDMLRTRQDASAAEVEAVRRFLAHPDHLVFICPHHDIGDVPDLPHDERLERQVADFLHHGDKTIPPQQGFGGFARSLLAGLGVGVENRFGLHPAAESDGSPAAIEAESALDRLHLLRGVDTFNLHPHLPQFERLQGAVAKLDVLVQQKIDLTAPPIPSPAMGAQHSMPCSNRGLACLPKICLWATRLFGSRPPVASTVYANSGPMSWNARTGPNIVFDIRPRHLLARSGGYETQRSGRFDTCRTQIEKGCERRIQMDEDIRSSSRGFGGARCWCNSIASPSRWAAAIDKKAVPEILITHLMEGIGIALDVPGNRMFVTDLAGSVYSADLDGKNERNFLSGQGDLTGVAYAEMQERVPRP